MIAHSDLEEMTLRSLIRKQHLILGGNRRLKIYGCLTCTSGKRMKRENRVFFTSEEEAMQMGYRPCGNCRKEAYAKFRKKTSSLH